MSMRRMHKKRSNRRNKRNIPSGVKMNQYKQEITDRAERMQETYLRIKANLQATNELLDRIRIEHHPVTYRQQIQTYMRGN